ncbi:NADPH-dependent F420 reductase [Sphingobium sp. JS3065]|uniref:NADPH-dependent F420 reductase n=1 Tax=Sphingobium sp. JS3065 TaxID=2970925 RepID=UPI0022642073|nr:NADPH-dependent F420 reductase [Sphingobium sp. JS3065]UZW57083.1 NADPH-dependent F420 reductase [Sphingobium sp. JS3065]
MTKTSNPITIAVLGGTGHEGGGLALRWARAGHRVIIGSRDGGRAATHAADLTATAGTTIEGMGNREAAAAAQIVVLAVPFSAQMATALGVGDELIGKILIDVTVPLVPPKVGRVQLPGGGSAVVLLQEKLGEAVKVVAAFQNISAHQLADLDREIDCDVLVSGDDEAARQIVVGLAEDGGMLAWHAGPLANSAAAEALTSVLISINRRYKIATGSGIRITGARSA